MTTIFAPLGLTLLALGLAAYAYWRWRKAKRIWYILSIIASILAGISFWLSLANGFFLLVPAVLLNILGEVFHK